MERKKPWLVFDESVGMRSPSRSIFPWLLISKYALTIYKSLRPYFTRGVFSMKIFSQQRQAVALLLFHSLSRVVTTVS